MEPFNIHIIYIQLALKKNTKDENIHILFYELEICSREAEIEKRLN